MKYKYVMYEDYYPLIFLPGVVHNEPEIRKVDGNKRKATSAGFIEITDDGKVTTFGESISLGMRPRPTDANVIQRHLTIAQVELEKKYDEEFKEKETV